ncbi:MAG: hypothetical protein LBI39_04555 [Puniceicoccales bacterium]|jgi:hypothetical protein|nr:hypothetical protein [Puniceicoccales bacterium]
MNGSFTIPPPTAVPIGSEDAANAAKSLMAKARDNKIGKDAVAAQLQYMKDLLGLAGNRGEKEIFDLSTRKVEDRNLAQPHVKICRTQNRLLENIGVGIASDDQVKGLILLDAAMGLIAAQSHIILGLEKSIVILKPAKGSVGHFRPMPQSAHRP